MLDDLLGRVLGPGFAPDAQHARPDALAQHRGDQTALLPVGMRGSRPAGLLGVRW